MLLRNVKYLRCVKRAAARRDLFHNNCKLFFTILRKQKISQCASIISHSAAPNISLKLLQDYKVSIETKMRLRDSVNISQRCRRYFTKTCEIASQ